MKKKLYLFLYVMMACLPAASAHQLVIDWFQKVRSQLQDKTNIAYQYTGEQINADSTTAKVKGFYAQKRGEILVDSSAEHLLIQTRDWYYMADHVNRTLIIRNLAREQAWFNRQTKDMTVLTDVNFLPDSVIVKYGKITHRDIPERGSIEFAIQFAPDILIRDLVLEVHKTSFAVIRYGFTYETPFWVDLADDESDAVPVERYITKKIMMEHLRYDYTYAKWALSNYFSEKNGKFQLKKYNHYKLVS